MCPTPGVIEERGIETLFAGNHNVCHALSLAIRTANTFVGSMLWIDFLRITGLQKAYAKKEDKPAVTIEEVKEVKEEKKGKKAEKKDK